MKNLQELIMGNGSDNVAVNARGLHDFLEVGKDFSNWFKDMTDYGFTQGEDFTPISAKSHGGRPRIEYAMTLDMAKELAMIQRTEKGQQARRYFISAEKQLAKQESTNKLPVTPREQIKLLLQGNEDTNQRVDHVESRLTDLEKNQKLDPGEYNWLGRRINRAVRDYMGMHNLVLSNSQRSKLFRDINRGVCEVAHVKTRTQIREGYFDDVSDYISDWVPSTATLAVIKQMGSDLPVAQEA
ncbi:toxin Bro [Levilactobacillus brevis]|nr:toxin Bro [Levilactobacillus brevis]